MITIWKMKQLAKYSGENASVTKPSSHKYWTSQLREVAFDDTFTFLPRDVNEGESLHTVIIELHLNAITSNCLSWKPSHTYISDEFFDPSKDRKKKKVRSPDEILTHLKN